MSGLVTKGHASKSLNILFFFFIDAELLENFANFKFSCGRLVAGGIFINTSTSLGCFRPGLVCPKLCTYLSGHPPVSESPSSY